MHPLLRMSLYGHLILCKETARREEGVSLAAGRGSPYAGRHQGLLEEPAIRGMGPALSCTPYL